MFSTFARVAKSYDLAVATILCYLVLRLPNGHNAMQISVRLRDGRHAQSNGMEALPNGHNASVRLTDRRHAQSNGMEVCDQSLWAKNLISFLFRSATAPRNNAMGLQNTGWPPGGRPDGPFPIRPYLSFGKGSPSVILGFFFQ